MAAAGERQVVAASAWTCANRSGGRSASSVSFDVPALFASRRGTQRITDRGSRAGPRRSAREAARTPEPLPRQVSCGSAGAIEPALRLAASTRRPVLARPRVQADPRELKRSTAGGFVFCGMCGIRRSDIPHDIPHQTRPNNSDLGDLRDVAGYFSVPESRARGSAPDGAIGVRMHA